MNNFGVKCVGDQHSNHLINVLKEHYTVAEDWKGERYDGITFDWDYNKRKVHMSMPGYVSEARVKFRHELCTLNHQPHKNIKPAYGQTIQYVKPEDTSPRLDDTGKKFIQHVTEAFLYYARTIDPAMLVTLNAIASNQAAPTGKPWRRQNNF